MKKQKHSEEVPEVSPESQVEELNLNSESSDDAADQIEDELEVMSQKCAEL